MTSLLSHQSLSAWKDGGHREHGLLWCYSRTLREEQREITAVRTSGLVNPVFSCQTGFSSASIYFLINRWLQLNLLYILSTGPLGLGSKVYPSNMQRMLNRGFTRFKQNLSRARQDRASKRKSLLAGWCLLWLMCYFMWGLTIQASKEQAAEDIILPTRQRNRNGLNIYTPRTTRKNRIREYKVWRAACNKEQ